MGKAPKSLFRVRQSDLPKKIEGNLLSRRLARCRTMLKDHFNDEVTHSDRRIQCRRRILWNEGNAPATESLQRPWAKREHLDVVKFDVACTHASCQRLVAEQLMGQRRLATT